MVKMYPEYKSSSKSAIKLENGANDFLLTKKKSKWPINIRKGARPQVAKFAKIEKLDSTRCCWDMEPWECLLAGVKTGNLYGSIS